MFTSQAERAKIGALANRETAKYLNIVTKDSLSLNSLSLPPPPLPPPPLPPHVSIDLHCWSGVEWAGKSEFIAVCNCEVNAPSSSLPIFTVV
jgi:hypothetical protein